MKTGLTQITIVLDRSGSMESVRAATVSSFNEFIKGQKAVPGEANITMIQFDSLNPFELMFDRKPLRDFPELTTENFVPRGLTPLHDAIGRTIIDLGAKLEQTPEENRPEKVVFVIMTDGQENASLEFKQVKIAEMIKHQQDVYNWGFLFLGADQDAILVGETLSISAAASMSYKSTPTSVRSATTSASAAIGRLRKGAPVRSLGFTDEERKKAR